MPHASTNFRVQHVGCTYRQCPVRCEERKTTCLSARPAWPPDCVTSPVLHTQAATEIALPTAHT